MPANNLRPSEINLYIAGFDVFKTNYAEIQQSIRKYCKEVSSANLKLIPIFPFEAEVTQLNSPQKTPKEKAIEIFNKNIEKILKSNAVVANLNSFRNKTEPDSGTVFECGFAYANKIPVYAFDESNLDWGSKIRLNHGTSEINSECDAEFGFIVEDFGYTHNLMLGVSSLIFPNIQLAINAVVVDFKTRSYAI